MVRERVLTKIEASIMIYAQIIPYVCTTRSTTNQIKACTRASSFFGGYLSFVSAVNGTFAGFDGSTYG